MAVQQFAIHDDAAADTRAQGEHDKVLHAFGTTVNHLAVGSSVGVIGDDGRQVQAFFHHLGQIDIAFHVEVGGILDAACVEVAVGCANAYAFHFHFLLVNELTDGCCQIVGILVCVAVLCGGEVLAGHHFARRAHQPDVGVRTTNVYSYCVHIMFI